MPYERVEVADVSVQVLREGRGAPLLLLHGADGLLFCRPFLQELARNYEIIAPVHPGWGETDLPDHFDTVTDIAELYNLLVEAIGTRMPVVGLSFGGWVAAQMAATCSHQLASLVLVSPIGLKIGGRENRDFADIYIADRDQLPCIWYGNPAAAPTAALGAFTDEQFFSLAQGQEALARYCWEPYMHDPKLKFRLPRITVPTLIVHGEQDRLVLANGYFHRFAELIGPNASVHPIAQSGHRVEEEAMLELAAATHAFLVESC